MAKSKSKSESKSGELIAQRRKAQEALRRNRVKVGPRKYRSLTPRERAAYKRVISRTDKLVGPVPAARREGGIVGLKSGLRTLKAFAERIRAGKEEFDKLPEQARRVAGKARKR